jgi:hypothetical protein
MDKNIYKKVPKYKDFSILDIKMFSTISNIIRDPWKIQNKLNLMHT